MDMNSTVGETKPMKAETSSGDKLIIFTPGHGREARIECDIVVNRFGSYGIDTSNRRHREGWFTASISVLHGGEEALVFTTSLPEEYRALYCQNPGQAFTHFALSFEGAVRIAAAKFFDGRWYFNEERAS